MAEQTTAGRLYDVWLAIGGWDHLTEEPILGGVKLNREPLPKDRAETMAVDLEPWAQGDYGRGELVLLDPATGERCHDAILTRRKHQALRLVTG